MKRVAGICKECGNKYEGFGKFYCSKICANKRDMSNGIKKRMQNPIFLKSLFKKGHIHSQEVRKKISEKNIIRFENSTPYNLGLPHSKETKEKLVKAWEKNRESRVGKNHWAYKEDRTTLKKENRRGDPLYFEWRKRVWTRDVWKCKINNKECLGRIEAHHILAWADYPELRYDINNGITLCHYHHPKKRVEERQLVPVFQSMIINK